MGGAAGPGPAAIPARRTQADQPLHRQRADAERTLPFGLRRIMAVVMQLGVVDGVDGVVLVVLLGEVDPRAVADAKSRYFRSRGGRGSYAESS